MPETINLFNNAASLDTSLAFEPLTGVRLWYDDEHAFFAGDETGRVLEADNPWATQAMADNMLEYVSGYKYQPYEAAGSLLDPAAELGDAVTVGGVYSVLASIATTFDALCASDISAPGDEEVDHEYPYELPANRELKRKVTLGRDYFGARISRAKGLEITKTAADGTQKSRAIFNSDVFAMYNDDGAEALYFDSNAGKFKFTGLLNVADNFIVDKDGNLTINGNINLSGGTITWGDNKPESGISASRARTIVSEELVQSPVIDGDNVISRTAFHLVPFGTDSAGDEVEFPCGSMGVAFGKAFDEDLNEINTYGVAMASADTSVDRYGYITTKSTGHYVIVTNKGVRLQAGENNITVTENGAFYNGAEIGSSGGGGGGSGNIEVDDNFWIDATGNIEIFCSGDGSDRSSIYLTTQEDNFVYINSEYLVPLNTKRTYCGSYSYQWTDGYFDTLHIKNSAVSASDRRLKENIDYDMAQYLALFDSLKPCSYKLIDGQRTHLGMIAQEVESAANDAGFDLEHFAAVCIDTENDVYGLRYEEFVPLLIAKVQQLDAELKALKSA